MILSTASTKYAFGGAMDTSSIGVKSWGMAAAFTGIADDSSAVHWNPAGLVFTTDKDKPWRAQASAMYFLDAHMKYTSRDGIKDESDSHTILPAFFISKAYDKWAFGFGNYLPYASGGSTYENFQDTRFDVKGASAYFAMSPAIAYKISPRLSIGASLTTYYAFLESEIVLGAPIKSEYKGLGGYGLHAGILYKPTDKFGIGLCIRGPIDIKFDGEVTRSTGTAPYGFREGTFDSEVEFTLPYYFMLGFGYKPSSDLTLGFDMCYMLYGDLEKMEFKTDGESTLENRTHYTDMWRLSLGMNYQLNNTSSLMTGIKLTEKSTKDSGLDKGTSRTNLVLIPSSNDIDLISTYVVYGHNYSEKIELDIGLAYTYGIERKVNSQKFDQDHLYLLLGSRFRF